MAEYHLWQPQLGSFKAAISDPGLVMATTTDPLRWVIDRMG